MALPSHADNPRVPPHPLPPVKTRRSGLSRSSANRAVGGGRLGVKSAWEASSGFPCMEGGGREVQTSLRYTSVIDFEGTHVLCMLACGVYDLLCPLGRGFSCLTNQSSRSPLTCSDSAKSRRPLTVWDASQFCPLSIWIVTRCLSHRLDTRSIQSRAFVTGRMARQHIAMEISH